MKYKRLLRVFCMVHGIYVSFTFVRSKTEWSHICNSQYTIFARVRTNKNIPFMGLVGINEMENQGITKPENRENGGNVQFISKLGTAFCSFFSKIHIRPHKYI